MKFKVGDKVYVREDAPIAGSVEAFKGLISDVLVTTSDGVLVLGLHDRTLTIDEGFCVHAVPPESRATVFADDLRRFLKVAKATLRGEFGSNVWVHFEGDDTDYPLDL